MYFDLVMPPIFNTLVKEKKFHPDHLKPVTCGYAGILKLAENKRAK